MFDAPADGPADLGVIFGPKVSKCRWRTRKGQGEVVFGLARSDAALAMAYRPSIGLD
jgi:hypothetical protein